MRVGFAASAALIPVCIGGLAASCSGTDDSSGGVQPPKVVHFTVDVSAGPLSTNGGFLVLNGIIIARTVVGDFIAVSVACTHQSTNVDYNPIDNIFYCSNHGSQFTSTGIVAKGPAERNLTKYNTSVRGTVLKVFS